MATIKSYTDIEQSKKLAKILPLDSADMSWVSCDDGKQIYYQAENRKIILNYEKKHWLPCWSLTALLKFIPNYNIIKHTKKITIVTVVNDNIYVSSEDNLLDACYEMILKLRELNML